MGLALKDSPPDSTLVAQPTATARTTTNSYVETEQY